MGANFQITIRVDNSQAVPATKEVTKELGNVKSAADSADLSLRSMLGTLASIKAVKELGGLADEYTNIRNKVAQVSTGQGDLNASMEETYTIAQRTRQSWDSVATVYTRTARSIKDLGYSNRDAMNFTRQLSTAVQVSGASANEAKNGMVQLSQGMALGVLRGQDLRSVMEFLPNVAGAIATHFGVTTGELKKMGAQGKITSKDIVESMDEADQHFQEMAGKTLPTFEQMWTQLHNAATKFFGSLAQGSGVMGVFSDVVDFVIENFDTFAKVIVAGGELLALYFGGRAIMKIVDALEALGVAIAANPFMALILALTAIILLLRQFGDQLDAGQDKITKVSDVLGVLWDDIKDAAREVSKELSGMWDAFADAADGAGDSVELTFKNVMIFLAGWVDAVHDLWDMLGKITMLVFGGIPVGIADVFTSMFQKLAAAAQAFINAIAGAINKAFAFTVENNPLYSTQAPSTDEILVRSGQIRKQEQADYAKQTAGMSAAEIQDSTARGYLSQPGSRPESSYRDIASEQLTHEQRERDKKPLGDVDFSFNNPFEGSEVAAKQQLDDILATPGSNHGAKDYMSGVFERAAERAREREERERNSPEDQVDDGAGPDKSKKPPPTAAELQKAAAETQRLQNALDKLQGSLSPIVKAQQAIADAGDVVAKSMDRGWITAEQGVGIMTKLREKYQDVLDPYGAMVKKITESYPVLGESAEVTKKNAFMQEQYNDSVKAGAPLTEAQKVAIAGLYDERARLVELKAEEEEASAREKKMLEDINAPLKAYVDDTYALHALFADGKISATQYADAILKVKAAYEATKPKLHDFATGMQSGLQQIANEARDVSSVLVTTLTDAFHDVEDSLVDVIRGVDIEWKKMTEHMLDDLARLIVRQAEAGLVGAIVGGPAFATGGSFTVGGTGGTDSQMVAFRASPGEQVTVNTPGQVSSAAMGKSGGGGMGQPIQLGVVNQLDRGSALNMMDSPEGRRWVINVIRTESAAVNTILGTRK